MPLNVKLTKLSSYIHILYEKHNLICFIYYQSVIMLFCSPGKLELR